MTYLTKSIPRSIREVLDVASHDRVLTIVKNTIANYINNYLDTMGVNRAIAEEIGSTTLNFITDKSTRVDDPSKFKVAVETLTEGIIESVPCILITDTGLEWMPSGLGQKDGVQFDGPDSVNSYAFMYKIPISIIIVTDDEASTKDLTFITSLMFGALQNLAGGNRITSEDDRSHWVITLPIIHPAPSFEKVGIENDNINKKWVGTLNIEIIYEAKAIIKIARDTVSSIEGNVAPPTTSKIPSISLPDTLSIGQTYMAKISWLEMSDTFALDQKNLFVTYEKIDDATFRLRAIGVGSFDIIVTDYYNNIKYRKTYNTTF